MRISKYTFDKLGGYWINVKQTDNCKHISGSNTSKTWYYLGVGLYKLELKPFNKLINKSLLLPASFQFNMG
jgi:hypothetical protein